MLNGKQKFVRVLTLVIGILMIVVSFNKILLLLVFYDDSVGFTEFDLELIAFLFTFIPGILLIKASKSILKIQLEKANKFLVSAVILLCALAIVPIVSYSYSSYTFDIFKLFRPITEVFYLLLYPILYFSWFKRVLK